MENIPNNHQRPKIAWLTYFPIEWLDGLPAELSGLPKLHPATWQRVLLRQFEQNQAIDLHVIALRKSFPRNLTFNRNGVQFHCFKTMGGLRAPTLYWLDTLIVGRALRRIRPDLAHAWGTEFGSAIVATRLPYRNLITMQGILTWNGELFPLVMHQKIGRYLEKASLRRAKHVTVESKFGMDYLQRLYPQLQLRQVEHAPDPIFFEVNRKPAINPPRLLSVGSLSNGKGGDVLFKALDLIKDQFQFELTFVGGRDPVMERELRQGLPAEIWNRTTFKNHLTSAQIAAEIAQATFMVYPTRADNSPNAVKEAVVAGLPVVASAIGGIIDYVIPGKNGFLFKTADVQECAGAIAKALSDSQFRAGRVDPDIFQSMRDYLSPKTMGEKFLSAYSQVLSNG